MTNVTSLLQLSGWLKCNLIIRKDHLDVHNKCILKSKCRKWTVEDPTLMQWFPQEEPQTALLQPSKAIEKEMNLYTKNGTGSKANQDLAPTSLAKRLLERTSVGTTS